MDVRSRIAAQSGTVQQHIKQERDRGPYQLLHHSRAPQNPSHLDSDGQLLASTVAVRDRLDNEDRTFPTFVDGGGWWKGREE